MFRVGGVMAEHELVSLRVQDCIGSRVVGDIRHIVAERDRLAAQLALARAERDKLQAFKDEADRLREAFRYWSYCTWSGLQRECPEKASEFLELCHSLGIEPYATRAGE